ncbi:hypothetical protein CEXT_507821 [Caerostris extrusa]|uniref:Uncharacterized protein n=1 Tax=Caerostris extrusa TaxID=172846 RepID=A0AAV4XBY4_CAEEX|nr:hypothetical protein CEXT_507821 [Caerostris extrusa]
MHLRLVVSFNSAKRQIKKNFYPFHCIVLCSFWNKSAGARWGGCEEEGGGGGMELLERDAMADDIQALQLLECRCQRNARGEHFWNHHPLSSRSCPWGSSISWKRVAGGKDMRFAKRFLGKFSYLN